MEWKSGLKWNENELVWSFSTLNTFRDVEILLRQNFLLYVGLK